MVRNPTKLAKYSPLIKRWRWRLQAARLHGDLRRLRDVVMVMATLFPLARLAFLSNSVQGCFRHLLDTEVKKGLPISRKSLIYNQ